jgi:hypothetical protein
MIMDNIVLSPIPIDDLLDKVRQLVRDELLSVNQSIQDEKMISAKEACKMFIPSITRPTLDKLCEGGKLTKHYIGSRVYFKQSEVLGSAKSFKKYVQAEK